MSGKEDFARAAERLTLAKEIKRQEENLKRAAEIIAAKKRRLAELEGDKLAEQYWAHRASARVAS